MLVTILNPETSISRGHYTIGLYFIILQGKVKYNKHYENKYVALIRCNLSNENVVLLFEKK